MTAGVRVRGDSFLAKAIASMRAFCDFNTDNDPRSEHDFGSITFEETLLYFKIDYYDLKHEGISAYPSDPLLTARVLTILEASEY